MKSGMFNGFVDWHSHILPGVDDGFKTIEDSLKLLGTYDELGVKKLWLTPHIMEDYPNETSDLRKRFEELCNAWDGNVELRLASENMLDSLFEERLEKKDFLPIGDDGKHLLVETSYFNPPMNMDELLENVMGAGYEPVLAHPERYRYMDKNDYLNYKDMGVLFQVNFFSLIGLYGETARGNAEWLLRNGMVDLTGSDLHRYAVLMNNRDMAPNKHEIMELLLKVAQNPAIS